MMTRRPSNMKRTPAPSRGGNNRVAGIGGEQNIDNHIDVLHIGKRLGQCSHAGVVVSVRERRVGIGRHHDVEVAHHGIPGRTLATDVGNRPGNDYGINVRIFKLLAKIARTRQESAESLLVDTPVGRANIEFVVQFVA